MDHSNNAPLKQARTNTAWVWFDGDTALKEGQGVCFNFDYGTATAPEAQRYNRVELPAAGNAAHFAGVAAREYAAKVGGQFIEINLPGSVCKVLVAAGVSATVGATALVCSHTGTPGSFIAVTVATPETGKGCAVALQSITGGASALKCLAVLSEGLQSGLKA